MAHEPAHRIRRSAPWASAVQGVKTCKMILMPVDGPHSRDWHSGSANVLHGTASQLSYALTPSATETRLQGGRDPSWRYPGLKCTTSWKQTTALATLIPAHHWRHCMAAVGCTRWPSRSSCGREPHHTTSDQQYSICSRTRPAKKLAHKGHPTHPDCWVVG